jgi:multidrug efflux pump subunit AcrA (membrane-fusion protein)
VAFRIFKSRLLKLAKFCHSFYLARKELMRTHWRSLAAAGALAAVLLFAPVRREEIDAPFVLEPAERAVLRAALPGEVQDVYVTEGMAVRAGTKIATLSDPTTDDVMDRARSGLRTASARATEAQLDYTGFGGADAERRQWVRQLAVVTDRIRRLELTSPIDGVVVTPRPQDLKGAWVAEGTTIAEVQNTVTLRARIFVPEPDMRVLTRVTGHSLKLKGEVWPLQGSMLSVSATPQQVVSGLIPASKYKGLELPPQYTVLVTVDNSAGILRDGMTGEAKIFGVRRSAAGFAWRVIADFVGRKIW